MPQEIQLKRALEIATNFHCATTAQQRMAIKAIRGYIEETDKEIIRLIQVCNTQERLIEEHIKGERNANR